MLLEWIHIIFNLPYPGADLPTHHRVQFIHVAYRFDWCGGPRGLSGTFCNPGGDSAHEFYFPNPELSLSINNSPLTSHVYNKISLQYLHRGDYDNNVFSLHRRRHRTFDQNAFSIRGRNWWDVHGNGLVQKWCITLVWICQERHQNNWGMFTVNWGT